MFKGLETIPKDELSLEEYELLKEKLTINNPEYTRAITHGSGYTKGIEKELTFYFETVDSITVPRQSMSSILDFEPTDFSKDLPKEKLNKFLYKLRDYQVEFFNEIGTDLFTLNDMVWEVPCGHGKCLGKGTLVRMYNGTLKKVECLVVGDLLMGDDNTPRKILSLSRGKEQMYWIRQKSGLDYRVNESHILSLKNKHKGIIDISVKDYIDKTNNFKNTYLGYKKHINLDYKKAVLDSYFLGLWLGDGSSAGASLTTDFRDKELICFYYDYATKCGLSIRVENNSNNSNNYYFTTKHKGSRNNFILNSLRELNLLKNKHIPDNYLYSDRQTRLNLLAGLIDTDGSYHRKNLSITQKSKLLKDHIIELCYTLGFSVREGIKVIKGVKYYRLNISGNIHEIPTRLKRKKIHKRVINKDPYVTSIKIEKDIVDDYYGFTLDGNKRFLLQDGTVTHNTTMMIYYASMLKQKTLIVVPTNFLARQWNKRLKFFVEEDALLLTSKLSEKDSPLLLEYNYYIVTMDMFNGLSKDIISYLNRSVGVLALDEGHRLGAATYHPILAILDIPKRICLTATFRRADNNHRLLHYHFGTIFSMDNKLPKANFNPLLTGIAINTLIKKDKVNLLKKYFEHLDYVETLNFYNLDRNKLSDQKTVLKMNCRGYQEKQEFSKITKKPLIANIETYLAEEPNRNKKFKTLIRKALDKGRSVLVLSKRKDVLKKYNTYFKDKYKTALVLGGSKLTDDEQEEMLNTSQLILGIMQLAQEGLDVEHVDTLVLLHAIKDTEQAVGRITRIKEGKKQPEVFYPLDNDYYCQSIYRNCITFVKRNATIKKQITFKEIETVL